MKVLITGGTGFVGSHAVRELLGAGHEVRLLARTPAKVPRVLGPLGVAVADVVEGDMTDPTAVDKALDGCDAVIHAAASVAVTGADNQSVVDANVTGTHRVVGGAVERGIDPVVHVSSIAVFVPPAGDRIDVDSPLARAHNPYGVSKVEAETFARSLQDAGAPVSIVYPGAVYGPHQPQLDASLEGMKSALEQVWPLTAGGVTIVDVRDLARLLSALLRPGRGGRRLMAAGPYLTWAELADLTDELTGRPARRLVLPARLMRGLGRLLDWAKRVRPFHYALTYDAAQFMTTLVPADDRGTFSDLGIALRPTRETLEDSLRWMLEAGHLRPDVAPRLAS